MRHHLRLLVFCCVAALTAGCSDTNKTNYTDNSLSPNYIDNSLSPNLAPCASIGDRVWVDTNCDGTQDGGEPGYPGATVELYTCVGALVGSTTTDANGNYLFSNLEDTVDYRVRVLLPAGFAFTAMGVGGIEAEDSDADATGYTHCVDVASCKAPRYIDVGLCRVAEPCGSIGDRVWADANCNGIQDGGEVGVPGVTVQLYTCEGALVSTDVTDGSGNYLFDNLDDQIDYRVCFVLPPGYTFSPANQGGVEADDSDAGVDGCTSCIDLNDCKAPRTVDAGLCRVAEPCGSIGDRVWADANCNGIQDGGEVGVPGVTVQLYTCEGALVSTDVTDGSGIYLFDNLDDQIDYRVCFVLPAGYTFSPANQGGVEANDSDAGADGCTSCIDLNDCKAPRTVDAGLCREEEVGEGCSPGFWKNHYTHWEPTGFSPDDVFDVVFGCSVFGDGTTLGDAIHNEITHNQLAFHGVAALLNASHPTIDSGLSVDDVKAMVCAGDLQGLQDAFVEDCELSGGNTNGGGNGKKK